MIFREAGEFASILRHCILLNDRACLKLQQQCSGNIRILETVLSTLISTLTPLFYGLYFLPDNVCNLVE